ncbi:16S rRNA (cytosine967-C5)-methyltransferase [Gemmobacter megaterium]|uniref:16S rRNA (Cytosine967-C5)-methyltransferase n=1 Tax=Gemmobacter megaterium TaxID=1086013 RepID=A0A1N7PQ96_9RHOB|nr:RsmB/NOP family class I SAM-dependent RNA methyltransferase [Gemmobacter megaterium]GGE20571.1 16S rRNA methyltransferase [Gemmobacter megaterium]SIT12715.1 16S rRNA (cytosine967-C5)-methyltransferase [Gemmobacter megaterium]
MSEGLAARRAAVALLLEATGSGRLLSDILADPTGPLAGLNGPDRARAQRLTLATLRRIQPADATIAPHIRRTPAPLVLAVLRLAVAELAERPQDAHGIVSEAVTLVRSDPKSTQASGFVNAVLRRISAAPVTLETQRLPVWLRRPLVQRFGKATVKAIEAAHLAGPMLDLTVRHSADTALWADRLGAEVLPGGSLRLAPGVQVTALPGYETGEWWVQDAAAAIPARVLAVQPGESVLDMCAAPGGKTLQLAAAGARVVALDASGARMERVRENLARTGLQAELVVADALEWQGATGFDAILLDAPCSATGTIRRHPELPFVKDPADLPGLVALQSALIDRAIALLRPGGRLVYCTCSLLPDEGENQMAAALDRHPQMARDQKAVAGWPGNWDAKGGGLRIRPDHWAERGGLDGFFIGAMRKSA